jgi:hypothetical protein
MINLILEKNTNELRNIFNNANNLINILHINPTYTGKF